MKHFVTILTFCALFVAGHVQAFDSRFERSTPSVALAVDSDAVDVSEANAITVDTSGGNVTIGGLAGGNIGQEVTIYKTELANDLIIEHNAAAGTEKIIMPDSGDATFSNRGGITFRFWGTHWYGVASTITSDGIWQKVGSTISTGVPADNLSMGGNVGVGIAPSADRLSIKALPTSSATLGTELVTNGDFASDLSGWTAGAGWSWSAGTALHTAGNTATLEQGISTTTSRHYQVSVTISGRTAGTVVMTLQNSLESFDLAANSTYKYSFKAGSTATNNLVFTPGTTFDGALDDVTIKIINPATTSDLGLYDVDGNLSGLVTVTSAQALENLFLGRNSGIHNTTGYYNTFNGKSAGHNNTTGNYNTFSGGLAG